jgi:hypothetical protein
MSDVTPPVSDEELFAATQASAPPTASSVDSQIGQTASPQPLLGFATEQNTCTQEMNTAVTCLQQNIDECGCFVNGVVSFRDDFPRDIRKQFYSAQAWLPSTDLFFCEVANQRVCRNYETVQSCCCTEQTTSYKDCFINNVLIYELPIPSGCYSTCESTVELRPDVAGGGAVEVVYTNDSNKNSTILVVVLAGVLGIVLIVGALIGFRYQKKKWIKRKNEVEKSARSEVAGSSGLSRRKSKSSPTLKDGSTSEEESSSKKQLGLAEEGMVDPCGNSGRRNSQDQAIDRSESSESSDDNSTIRTKEMTYPRSFDDGMSLPSNTAAVDLTPSIYQAKRKSGGGSNLMLSPRPSRINEEGDGQEEGQESRNSYSVHGLLGSLGKNLPSNGGSCSQSPVQRTVDDVKKDRDDTKDVLLRLETTQVELQRLMEKSKAEALALSGNDPMSEWSRNEITKELREIKVKMMQLQDAKKFYETQLATFKTELKLLKLEDSSLQRRASLMTMEQNSSKDTKNSGDGSGKNQKADPYRIQRDNSHSSLTRSSSKKSDPSLPPASPKSPTAKKRHSHSSSKRLSLRTNNSNDSKINGHSSRRKSSSSRGVEN